MNCLGKELRIIQLKKAYGLTDAEAERRIQIGEGLMEAARSIMKRESITERLREVVRKARQGGKFPFVKQKDCDSQGCYE